MQTYIRLRHVPDVFDQASVSVREVVAPSAGLTSRGADGGATQVRPGVFMNVPGATNPLALQPTGKLPCAA